MTMPQSQRGHTCPGRITMMTAGKAVRCPKHQPQRLSLVIEAKLWLDQEVAVMGSVLPP